MISNEICVIIGVNVALVGILATVIVYSLNKVDADVKALCTRMDKMESRMDGHASRIDQLYKMFVDLLREMKK